MISYLVEKCSLVEAMCDLVSRRKMYLSNEGMDKQDHFEEAVLFV